MQKFSSNVVEKFLEKGGEFVINKYIEEISINNRIVDLMKNNYGNYVVQKALKLANEKNMYKLIEVISKNLDKIGDKKLISKWKSIVQSRLEEKEDKGSYHLRKQNTEEAILSSQELNYNFKRVNSLNVPNTNNIHLDFIQRSAPNYSDKPQSFDINTCYNISQFSGKSEDKTVD